MSKFLTPLRVEDEDGEHWKLCAPLEYLSTKHGCVITVPDGFETDFASIPQAVQSLISKNGPWDFGAVIHDALYSAGGLMKVKSSVGVDSFLTYSRADADDILLEAMQCKDVGWVRCQTIYRAVRMFGGSHWLTPPSNSV